MSNYGFELIKDQDIPEINSRARLFKHVKTGAELLSIENDDENKAFGINFRTPPDNSTGIPHIMEHSVLCGSKKYPLKEPFIELIKGSLKTFLNAFTYPDKTCYPVASTNHQDFYNLIDVYMDAVFNPILSPYTLLQEGWHYELEDAGSEMEFKGVVYNEMKGAYSSPDNLLIEKSQQSLFPDITYGLDSGGDPKVIPSLTYEYFMEFHNQHYHPSNSRIYFYGDDDPEKRLKLMAEWMEGYEPIEVFTSVPLQPVFDHPITVKFPYESSADTTDPKYYITTNWMLSEVGDSTETIGLAILTHILLGSPASPLRKALIESGLGEDVAGVGLENELRQMFFSTGMKGVVEENVSKVEDLIYKTLQDLVNEGIDENTILASLNTVEFQLRENNTGAFPRGLSLMLRALTTWLHDKDPIQSLAFEESLNTIKRRYQANNKFFESMIKTCLLDNPHRSTVILEPDSELASRREADETAQLEEARSSMDEEKINNVISNTKELIRRQETPDSPEDLKKIPSLNLEDLEKKVKTIPIEVLEPLNTQVLYHDLFTNGIFYLDVGFDLHSLDQDLLPLAPIFGRALLEMGTEEEDYISLNQRIGRSTGGINPTTLITPVLESDHAESYLFLRGKSTTEKTNHLLAILKDILSIPKFNDPERFKQIVLESKAGLESRLIPAGHMIVNNRVRAHFEESGWVSEQISGISQLFYLRNLLERIESDWVSVLKSLEKMRQILVNRTNMIFNLTIDQTNWNQIKPSIHSFIEGLPSEVMTRIDWQVSEFSKEEGLTIPSQVNYVAKAFNLFDVGYENDGSSLVIAPYLSATYLWDHVRVKGGAYGGFCDFDWQTGIFSFLSYRDPNLAKTLNVYDKANDFLQGIEMSSNELTKAVIGAIGRMDAYQLPDAKGYTSLNRYLMGLTDEFRQNLRNDILSTEVPDFKDFGKFLEIGSQKSVIAVLGSADAVNQANQDDGMDLKITKIL